jgi:hypothetical protein
MTSKTGLTYVVTHSEFGSVKVGCTTYQSRRLRDLWRQGWELHDALRLPSKGFAQMVEQGVLLHLRHRLGLPPHLTAELMPHGWSETVSARLIDAAGVWNLVCEEAAAIQMAPVVGTFKPTLRCPPNPHKRTKGDTPKFAKIARTQARITAKQNAYIPTIKQAADKPAN